jgi:hypothetical protein
MNIESVIGCTDDQWQCIKQLASRSSDYIQEIHTWDWDVIRSSPKAVTVVRGAGSSFIWYQDQNVAITRDVLTNIVRQQGYVSTPKYKNVSY